MIRPLPSDLILVFDASPLIVLSELGILNLLIELSRKIRIIIPDSVLNELTKHPYFELYQFQFELKNIKEENIRDYLIFLEGLDSGEQGALKFILWSKETKKSNLLFATDDKRARKIAEKLGIKVIGTLGLIELFKRAGLLRVNEAVELINRTALTSLYITREIINKAVRKVIQQIKNKD